MTALLHLLSPPLVGIFAVFFAIVWMLRDESDKSRPLLVLALIFNLVYGWIFTTFLSRADSLLPYKYDFVLARLDEALGVSAARIAPWLQGAWRPPLVIVYELMIPMMIAWFFAVRDAGQRRSLVLAYIAELVTGPLMYALLPACGPVYAFGTQWLHPPQVPAQAIRLNGMPNAFPSLHMGTAFVLLLFAAGRRTRAVALLFLLATAAATISTGEHYCIDLVPGLAFGAYAAFAGAGDLRQALFFLAIVASWSLSVRFAGGWILASPMFLRSLEVATIACASWAAYVIWKAAPVATGELVPAA
jgi:hypothetical protein